MIVVTGATGNVGQPLVKALVDSGHAVTAVTRGASHPLPVHRGVRSVVADLTAPDSLKAAFNGAEALFLLAPGAGELDAPHILRIAQEQGVARIVLLSSQAAGTRPGSISHAPLAALEASVMDSGMMWTILRPAGFHTNALAWAPTVRSEKAVYAPFGDIALPGVDSLDIAAVAAAALTNQAHSGSTYVLTGPEATTPRQRTEVLGRALGFPLSFVELTRDEARARMLEFMPDPVVEGTLAILGEPTPEERVVSVEIETVLDRPGRSFADWARRHTDMFR